MNVFCPRRRALWACVALSALLVRPASGTRPVATLQRVAARPSAPNIVIIVGDDHAGGTLGIDGDPRRATLRLDALARQGVRFHRAFCNAPVCSASRASFLTGRLPHAVGVTLLPTPLPDDATTLGDWLGEFGYETAAFGKMHFNGPSDHGYAERVQQPDWRRHLRTHPPEHAAERPWRPFKDPAATWLNSRNESSGLPAAAMESRFYADRAAEFFGREHDRPFALVVGFTDPHSPFRFPDDTPRRFTADDFIAPTSTEANRLDQPKVFADLTPADARGIRAAYYNSLASLDENVGRIVDAIDASGHADDTIVVYLGDNGYMLGQHGRFEKHCMYDPAVRVPLIMRWPGHLPADREVDALVELVDLVPTLLDLGGLPRPDDLQGRSLVPLLLGEPGAVGRYDVFSEYLDNEEAMVRTDRYKLIVGTGARLRQDGYATGRPLPGPSERLFDLVADPEETENLADRPDLAETLTDLRHRLHDRLVFTRSGRDSAPSGLTEIETIRWCLTPHDLR